MTSIKSKFQVTLVGRRHLWCENLSLGYVRSALDIAGCEVVVHRLNNMGDVERIGKRIMARPPGLLAISIPETNSAFLTLTLGTYLNRRGYGGHITVGGQFATISRRWLLKRYSWLDSVVRFAGEKPITALANCLANGQPVDTVPGLTTRNGDGLPTPPCELSEVPWPHRDELSTRMGYNAALVAASRGCPGQCAYCGPAALQQMERDEAKAAGMERGEMVRCGVGGVKRRDVEDLCDEMANLYHERGVRYFGFVDEHFLPFHRQDALGFIDQFHDGLKQRRVTGYGFGCQLHCAHLTPLLVDRLVEAGLVRVHLGLDLAEELSGKQFGRTVFGAKEKQILEELERVKVATVSNIMALHPYSTPDTISASLQLMETLNGGLFETVRMAVYEGTGLKEMMAEENRLFGNPLKWNYHNLDPIAERFTVPFLEMRYDVFGNFSIAHRAHESAWNLALGRRLDPRVNTSQLQRRFETISFQIRRTYAGAYRSLYDWAVSGGSIGEKEVIFEMYRQQKRFIDRALYDIEVGIEGRYDLPRQNSRVFKTFAASFFAFSVMGAAATGCSKVQGDSQEEVDAADTGYADGESEIEAVVDSEDDVETASTASEKDTGETDDPLVIDSSIDEDSSEQESNDESETPSDVGSGASDDAEIETDSLSETDTMPVEVSTETDSGIEEGTDTEEETETNANTEHQQDAGRDTEPVQCDSNAIAADEATLIEDVHQIDSCFTGTVNVGNGNIESVYMYPELPSYGMSNRATIDGEIMDVVSAEVEKGLQDERYPCLINDGVGQPYRVYIEEGGMQDDVDLLYGNIDACGDNFGQRIVIDENGRVVSVGDCEDASSGTCSEVESCMMEALDGLTFSCIAGTEIEYVVLII